MAATKPPTESGHTVASSRLVQSLTVFYEKRMTILHCVLVIKKLVFWFDELLQCFWCQSL